MNDCYTILTKVLNTEYHLGAAIAVLDTLESTYREEDQFELKALAAVIKGYLCGVEKDVKETIEYIDALIVQKNVPEAFLVNKG